jgi:GntR family transcriptional regulator
MPSRSSRFAPPWRGPEESAISRFLNPFPKYLQIRQLLLRRLQQDFRPGDPFPSDQVLVREFGVSRETVREAMLGLAEQGWISRHRGQGTFVCKAPKPKADRRVTGLAEALTDLKADTRSEVLQQGVIRVPLEIAGRVDMKPDDSIYRIVRLRFFEGKPLSYIETYLPIDIGERIAKLDLERSSIMAELKKTLRVRFHEEQQTIDAVAADAEVARLLDVPVGSPVLLLSRLLLLGADERPILFRSYYRADRYYYTVQLAGRPKAHAAAKAKARKA